MLLAVKCTRPIPISIPETSRKKMHSQTHRMHSQKVEDLFWVAIPNALIKFISKFTQKICIRKKIAGSSRSTIAYNYFIYAPQLQIYNKNVVDMCSIVLLISAKIVNSIAPHFFNYWLVKSDAFLPSIHTASRKKSELIN